MGGGQVGRPGDGSARLLEAQEGPHRPRVEEQGLGVQGGDSQRAPRGIIRVMMCVCVRVCDVCVRVFGRVCVISYVCNTVSSLPSQYLPLSDRVRVRDMCALSSVFALKPSQSLSNYSVPSNARFFTLKPFQHLYLLSTFFLVAVIYC